MSEVSACTEPDFYVQRAMKATQDENFAMCREQAVELHFMGATWLRATPVEEHKVIIFEGWKVRPEQEPPFHMWVAPS